MFIRIAQLATHDAWFWWELAWGGMQIFNGSDRDKYEKFWYLFACIHETLCLKRMCKAGRV